MCPRGLNNQPVCYPPIIVPTQRAYHDSNEQKDPPMIHTHSNLPRFLPHFALLTLLVICIAGCVSFPVMTTPNEPVRWNRNTRTLIVFAPGTKEGKQRYFAALDRLGIRYEVGLQINAYLPKKEHVPTRISQDRINAREAFTKANKEWNPKPPILAFYDYEPDHGSWNWDVQKRGYNNADMRFFRRAVAELRAYQQATGNSLPLGFYGQPVTRKDQPWNEQDHRNVIRNKPLLDGFDWVILSIYSRGAVVNEQTEPQHREKIRRNWEIIREVYPDRPVVPMVYLNEIKPDDEYGRVYFDEFDELNIATVGLWANPGSEAKIRFSIKQLEENADYIRAWQRGNSD